MKKIPLRFPPLLILVLVSCNIANPQPNSSSTVSSASTGATATIAGDLGWGTVHGKVIDATTGTPIVGAAVTCEHHSYTSPATCSGTVTTDAQGIYIFETVFFHDTDTIKLTVQATGYQPGEFKQTSFTRNDMETDISLTRVP